MPALTPIELAAALYNDGRRAIDGTRIGKFVRHIESYEDFEGALAALPEDVRDRAREMAEPLVRKKLKA